jgi:GNAT superfamily N-acetyltransferase
MVEIAPADTDTEIAEARTLFREYEHWLELDLCFQGFEAELASLLGVYAPPAGILLLAYCDEKLAGCIALRKLEEGICEMKRLFVRDSFRGLGIGNLLIDKLIIYAQSIGYTRMRLDTYPAKMGKAVKLYESHGFSAVGPYYHNPHDGVLFLEKNLK